MSDTVTKLSAVTKPVRFTVELTEDQALAYAQFLKRVGFSDYMGNAVDQDEAYLRVSAGERLLAVFASVGFSPR
jgi:hypothetical protein